jgi:putative transposase
MILTYKYRLKGRRAARQLRHFAWAANQVWNYCVQTQRSVQRVWNGGLSVKWPTHLDFVNLTTGTSKDLGIHAQSIQCVCDQFTKSRDQYKKCPRFRKSCGTRRSLGWIPFQAQSRKITGNAITYLGNIYRFFGAKRRQLPPIVKGGAFVEDARGHWWVCFHVDVANDMSQAPDVSVGIDLGLKTLATFSTGEKIEAPRTFRLWEDKLAVAQRAGNRDRAKAINAKIKNSRNDHNHKWTTDVAMGFRIIFVGDVSSSQLAKTRMAKSVYDASWSTARGFLRYKASRRGGTAQEVEEAKTLTTQTCSTTGIVPPESPKGIAGLGIREWWCSACGEVHDRDVNAARNILRLGLSAQPRVDESQLPTMANRIGTKSSQCFASPVGSSAASETIRGIQAITD